MVSTPKVGQFGGTAIHRLASITYLFSKPRFQQAACAGDNSARREQRSVAADFSYHRIGWEVAADLALAPRQLVPAVRGRHYLLELAHHPLPQPAREGAVPEQPRRRGPLLEVVPGEGLEVGLDSLLVPLRTVQITG